MKYQLGELKPNIDNTCFIAPNAILIGNVTISAQASIWFNVVIRADLAPVHIGEKTNIQDGSILHVDPAFPMTIGNKVTVGHKVMLHGCTIGDNSLVGMNAVILNGASIGKNCLIGANALITENMKVPDGHLALGSPAKVIKALDKETQEKLAAGAQHYVEAGAHYIEHLKALD